MDTKDYKMHKALQRSYLTCSYYLCSLDLSLVLLVEALVFNTSGIFVEMCHNACTKNLKRIEKMK